MQASPEDWIPDVAEREINENYVLDFFKLTSRAKDELNRIHLLNFNIFQLCNETEKHEFVPTITMILARERCFTDLPVSFETFMRFILKIKNGYNNVPYHNKTHGADVA